MVDDLFFIAFLIALGHAGWALAVLFWLAVIASLVGFCAFVGWVDRITSRRGVA